MSDDEVRGGGKRRRVLSDDESDATPPPPSVVTDQTEDIDEHPACCPNCHREFKVREPDTDPLLECANLNACENDGAACRFCCVVTDCSHGRRAYCFDCLVCRECHPGDRALRHRRWTEQSVQCVWCDANATATNAHGAGFKCCDICDSWACPRCTVLCEPHNLFHCTACRCAVCDDQ